MNFDKELKELLANIFGSRGYDFKVFEEGTIACIRIRGGVLKGDWERLLGETTVDVEFEMIPSNDAGELILRCVQPSPVEALPFPKDMVTEKTFLNGLDGALTQYAIHELTRGTSVVTELMQQLRSDKKVSFANFNKSVQKDISKDVAKFNYYRDLTDKGEQ